MMRQALKTAGLLTIMALVIGPQTVLALDDGGGRSVFARGAGERALALGGAYGAVANDPGSMIWNPGGLARLNQKNLYASHTSLIGYGFSEQLGLFALPSWKFGTIGVGFRRFGVDGIEGRDDRGAIFDDNLKDSETEIILGYGRRLGGVWDLGLAFKYQQHDLAGHSDGAPGLDVGVIVKPLRAAGGKSTLAQNLSLGFAVRNLIEPNLRLDEEAVKDPTGLRIGLAYDGDVSRNLHLLLATDLEKTREMDTRIHLGAELELMGVLALRAGSNSGMMTAGAGVKVRNLAVDYTFEDNPLETVHRFGVGMAFGPTTEESRQASLDIEEAKLRDKLESAFLKENNNRVRSIMSQINLAMQKDQYEEALRMVETVRVLEPESPELDKLESDAYFGQGQIREGKNDLSGAAIAYRRCLVINPRHSEAAERLKSVSVLSNQLALRSEMIRAQFDDALEAYARGDLVQARDGFSKILEIKPDDQESAALLRSTRQTLDLRAGSLIEQARAMMVAGNFNEARQSLEQARILTPDNPLLDSTAAAIIAKERQLEADREAARLALLKTSTKKSAKVKKEPVRVKKPTFAALSAKDQQEVADLYRKGIEAVEAERHQDAIRYWELVWSRAPDYQLVAENLKQEYLDQGMEAFADGRLDQSIEAWEKARTVAPNDSRTKGYLARAYGHKTRIREIKGEH